VVVFAWEESWEGVARILRPVEAEKRVEEKTK
jgi:hypothetical protein